ncbi:MAG: uroporphyrinogen-III C-methyltransferase [Crocinitomicaceae bacterium]|nr:uroporphyrinogen-III C-methyltransferase [Crocinitomicaceae bacterium]
MKTNKNTKVTLVGAGPGDPKLITLAGVEALKEADIVLYDALVSKELLKYADNADFIYVGKRKNNHRYSQDEINRLIVSKAFEYGNVVRLKGGDPFIFGRGAEEIEYVDSFGIETEVIPGISSATSVPQRQGISLTQRGVSESFWVITGTTTQRKLSQDLALAAQSTATVVLLMGMSNLGSIVREYQTLGKGNIPVAIIQNGFLENENVGIGRIDTIEEIVKDQGLSNPSIIVIGEVVRTSNKLAAIYDDVESFYTEKSNNLKS